MDHVFCTSFLIHILLHRTARHGSMVQNLNSESQAIIKAVEDLFRPACRIRVEGNIVGDADD